MNRLTIIALAACLFGLTAQAKGLSGVDLSIANEQISDALMNRLSDAGALKGMDSSEAARFETAIDVMVKNVNVDGLNLEEAVQYGIFDIIKQGMINAANTVKGAAKDAAGYVSDAANAAGAGLVSVGAYIGNAIDKLVEAKCAPALESLVSPLSCTGAGVAFTAVTGFEFGVSCIAVLAPPLASIGGVGAGVAPAICGALAGGVIAAAKTACTSAGDALAPVLKPKIATFCKNF